MGMTVVAVLARDGCREHTRNAVSVVDDRATHYLQSTPVFDDPPHLTHYPRFMVVVWQQIDDGRGWASLMASRSAGSGCWQW